MGDKTAQNLRMRFTTFDPVTLGKSIRLARAYGGLSLDEVSRYSGVALSNVWKIESGKGSPAFATVLAILEAVGIPPAYAVADGIRLDRDRFYDAAFSDIQPRLPEAEIAAARAFSDWAAGCSVLVVYALLSANPECFSELDYPTEYHRNLLAESLRNISLLTPVFDRVQILTNIEESPVTVLHQVGLWDDEILSHHSDWLESLIKKGEERPKWIPATPRRVDTLLNLPPIVALEKSLTAMLKATQSASEQRKQGLPTHEGNAEKSQQSHLPLISDLVNVCSVSPLNVLFSRLQAVTTARGKKTELAAFLNVPLARVSQWLSRDREPGGDTTLRLLQWVQAEESKQKSSAGALTPAEPKTRSKKSSHEKLKPSSPEK